MKIIVVIPTFYANKDDIRYHLALDCCRAVAQCGSLVKAIVVDASPSEDVRQAMREHGTDGEGNQRVRVVPQTVEGKKGAALREGIALAATELESVEDGIIGFQEPEKVDMIQHWKTVAELLLKGADICAPRRSDASFKETYPIEQYHSENFANFYLDALANDVGFPSIDWTIGPMAFKASLAKHWAKYQGDLWDMQLVPMVRAQRWHNAKVVTYEFDYCHPASMKEEELGVPKWSEKRLFQLNFLFEHVGNALKETANPIG